MTLPYVGSIQTHCKMFHLCIIRLQIKTSVICHQV